MSRDHADAVRRAYDRYAEGDFRAAAALFDPHVVLVLAPAFGPESPEVAVHVGVDAVAAYTRQLMASWADYRMAAEEILPAGDSVVIAVRQTAVGRVSGAAAEARYFTVWTFRGARVVRIESFSERSQALAAVGLGD